MIWAGSSSIEPIHAGSSRFEPIRADACGSELIRRRFRFESSRLAPAAIRADFDSSRFGLIQTGFRSAIRTNWSLDGYRPHRANCSCFKSLRVDSSRSEMNRADSHRLNSIRSRFVAASSRLQPHRTYSCRFELIRAGSSRFELFSSRCLSIRLRFRFGSTSFGKGS